MDAVVVRAPGSTSNLGSGFDTLGLAVGLHNHVQLRRRSGLHISMPNGEEGAAMAAEASDLFFKKARLRPFGADIQVSGKIPIARGLGASGAFRAAVVAGFNALSGANWSKEQLLPIVTELEGHPDNASPTLFGGCTVSGIVGGEVRCLRFPVSPALKLVTLVPEFRVATEEARRLVPPTFSRADTAHALNRSALIAAAFASRNYGALRGLFDDRVHQPHRESLVPGLRAVIAAGERAGAIGGFLSGSGSAIICLALERDGQVAQAMQAAMKSACGVMILRPDNRGLAVAPASRTISKKTRL